MNKRFKHGVPKLVRGVGGPRFSIIAWGRRRTINANNGGSVPRRDGAEARSAMRVPLRTMPPLYSTPKPLDPKP